MDIKELNRLLDEVGPTIQKANDGGPQEPMVAKTVDQQVANPYSAGINLSGDDALYLQRKLNPLSWEEKSYLLGKQLQKGMGTGTPVPGWMSGNPVLQKALDTSGGAALQRQDLDPFIVAMFVSQFKAWQRIQKVPANGVVHAWDQLTSYGDSTTSSFISELGTVVDKTGTYTRKTTNIAVYGQRRGVSFKQQLAVPAGGMPWDSAKLEIQNALIQMAHDLQKTIFQGQSTNSGGTASNEYGLYDANAFDGLRSQLNLASDTGVNFSPNLTSSPDNYVKAFNKGITTVADAVGVPPSVVYSRYAELEGLTDQQLSIQRTVDTTEFIPGVEVPAVMTTAGKMPVIGIAGDAIGHYTATTYSGYDVADMYMINEQELAVPYLGNPGPSVIEIPPAVSGQLSRLYIVWGMFGLALMSNLHSVKLRAAQRTS